ncbi:methionine tRS [Acrasis kona]|uniref:Methionine tRS n=1 Tax=Acrasis kona TaxID=1008807 RepID=A0AAW2ZI18_9EUKA
MIKVNSRASLSISTCNNQLQISFIMGKQGISKEDHRRYIKYGQPTLILNRNHLISITATRNGMDLGAGSEFIIESKLTEEMKSGEGEMVKFNSPVYIRDKLTSLYLTCGEKPEKEGYYSASLSLHKHEWYIIAQETGALEAGTPIIIRDDKVALSAKHLLDGIYRADRFDICFVNHDPKDDLYVLKKTFEEAKMTWRCKRYQDMNGGGRYCVVM